MQPGAREQNAFLKTHSWEEYATWHLALTEGADEQLKGVLRVRLRGFRRLHRIGLIACHYRAAEWRDKEIELAAHELLQYSTERLRHSAAAPRTSAPPTCAHGPTSWYALTSAEGSGFPCVEYARRERGWWTLLAALGGLVNAFPHDAPTRPRVNDCRDAHQLS